MITIYTSFAEYLESDTTGAIEELAIMRDDDISSLPGVLEVVLEPLDRDQIDKVSRLIE